MLSILPFMLYSQQWDRGTDCTWQKKLGQKNLEKVKPMSQTGKKKLRMKENNLAKSEKQESSVTLSQLYYVLIMLNHSLILK